ncbi:hypothetical protein [Pseudarthrobacter sp. SSS035]|uniref:hypothetical protein n=1 Tax=Pseudarthrobacter sp. SSS035 TaxID=2931399 RepID=UPI00200E7C3D|nr:hypothetical protein [Pseudarthrobacter sp. SSS035]
MAAQKLQIVLFELGKIHAILFQTVNDYLSLWLIPDEKNVKFHEEEIKLRSFASGGHEAEMRKAKGDCAKIWSIYAAYLQPWFSRVLHPEEADELSRLFRELSDIDSIMVDAIQATSNWLREEASVAFGLIQDSNYLGADEYVRRGWEKWQPSAKIIRDNMNRLYDLEASFINATRAI